MQWPTIDDGTRGQLDDRLSVSGLYPFLDGYGVYAGGAATNAPRDRAETPSSTPNTTLTTNPKIWTPSINIRVVNAARAPR